MGLDMHAMSMTHMCTCVYMCVYGVGYRGQGVDLRRPEGQGAGHRGGAFGQEPAGHNDPMPVHNRQTS